MHFPLNYRPDYLAWRALAVAASDLAAMGADPSCFTLALTLPEVNESWLRDFARGLGNAAESFGLGLAGGDTTRGPLTLSVQVHGLVEQGSAICRSGAMPGDLIVVSGALGDAGAALEYLDAQPPQQMSSLCWSNIINHSQGLSWVWPYGTSRRLLLMYPTVC